MLEFFINDNRNQNLTFLKQWDRKLHLSAFRDSKIREKGLKTAKNINLCIEIYLNPVIL
ncbi:hypothetical protein N134_05980 [Limosilactobacillus reuteri TD1]|uniref:Uncharacterized protein n=1 Tax=Limosilactobacillus reuteri TD1 TaxID=1358027 RepID=S5NEJ8_LIMRT|nr:hypothetical protein N134_05980 [Limosilactobacillus reuteri TD1]